MSSPPTGSSKARSIASSAVAGIGWNAIGNLVSTLSSLVIGTVLARILGPGPFGQAIVATTIYSLVNLFVDGGFSQALIQRKEVSQQDIQRTFTCQVGIGLLSTGMVFLAAPLIAFLFHVPSAAPVVRAVALLMTFQSLGLVSAALLRREMRFRVVQYASLGSYLFGYLVLGIPLALAGAGVWSLVIAYLSQSASNSAVLYLAARHSLRLSFALPERSVATFGATIIANNLVNWGHFNLDNLAASYRGPVALGLYGRSCNLAYQPVNGFAGSLQSVLFSSAAKLREQKQLIGQVALAAMVFTLAILGPAYATLACSPATIILGLYGERWLAAVPLMVPLALAMPFFGCVAVLNPIICGAGRPTLEFWPAAVSCALAALAYFVAIRFSLLAVAWALFGVTFIRFLITAGTVFAALGVSWAGAALAAAGRVAFSLVFGLCTWSFDRALVAAGMAAASRVAALSAFCLLLLGGVIWLSSTLVFGKQTVALLLRYSSHLPDFYARWLARLRVDAEPLVVLS